MKAIIGSLLVALVALTATSTFASPIPGDVNGDGQVTTFDISLVRRHIFGIEPLTPEQVARGDMNRDGQVTTFDIVLIRRQILGSPVVEDNRLWLSYQGAPEVKISAGVVAAAANFSIFSTGSGVLSGGVIQFSVASDIYLADNVQKQMELVVGDKIILGAFVVIEDEEYDDGGTHVGTVDFDLTGVEIVPGETKQAQVLIEVKHPCWIQARRETGQMLQKVSKRRVNVEGVDFFGNVWVVQ